jgi:enoyl-CoA hydratase/carnithine racemase
MPLVAPAIIQLLMQMGGFIGGQMGTGALMRMLGKHLVAKGGTKAAAHGAKLAAGKGFASHAVPIAGGFAGDIGVSTLMGGHGALPPEATSNEMQLSMLQNNIAQKSRTNQLALIDLLEREAQAGNVEPLLEQAGIPPGVI